MSELSITLLRLGFLILLWAFVLVAIGVLRSDLYGTRVMVRGRGRQARKNERDRANKVASPTRGATGVKTGAISTRERVAAHLAVTAGPLRGTTIPLGSAPVMIGRSPTSTLVIEDDYCSSRHCRVFLDGDQWMVEDLGSTNGTFLGDRRVDDPVPLRQGDKIRIGTTSVELRD